MNKDDNELMCVSLEFVDLVHIMHHEVLSDSLVRDFCHHAVYGFASELVKTRVCHDLLKTESYHLHDVLHLADVVRHYGHVD